MVKNYEAGENQFQSNSARLWNKEDEESSKSSLYAVLREVLIITLAFTLMAGTM
jgi:hypothetical protein